MPGITGSRSKPPGGGANRQGLIDPVLVAERYSLGGGTAPAESVLRRAKHLASLPPSRPAQRWADFTSAQLPAIVPGARPVPMRGPDAALHIRLLGLRADESNRVGRVLSRTLFAEGASTASCTVRTQPPGERPYFPLHEAGIDAAGVIDFWQRRDFDLGIPNGAGNCVFCFMKGTSSLVKLGAKPDARRRSGTPSDMDWWADFEERHLRTAPKRNGEGVSRFGFFGVNSATFADLASDAEPAAYGRYANGTPACDCTD